MSFQIHIERHWASFRYRVWLGERRDPGTIHLLTKGGEYGSGVDMPEATMPPEDGWFCEIPYDAAHQFLAELSSVLGAVEHPQQLRKDYEAERARVDRLIGFVDPKSGVLAKGGSA